MREDCELDGRENPRPGTPGYERFKRLDVLARGGLKVYREALHEEPPWDLVAEAEALRARWGYPPLVTPP